MHTADSFAALLTHSYTNHTLAKFGSMLLLQNSLCHITQNASHYPHLPLLALLCRNFQCRTLQPLLKDISLIKTHSKDCTLFDAPTTSGVHLMQPGTCTSRLSSSTCEMSKWQDCQTHVFLIACCLMLLHLKTKLLMYDQVGEEIRL